MLLTSNIQELALGKRIDGFIDGAYQQLLTPRLTRSVGRLGEVSLGDAAALGRNIPAAVGRNAVHALWVGGRTGSRVLRAAGLRAEIFDMTDPEQLLEYRERKLTIYKDFIMAGKKGVVFGMSLFNPWAPAARAADVVRGNEQKPDDWLAEDYGRTMNERGVDVVICQDVVEGLVAQLPKNDLDSYHRELADFRFNDWPGRTPNSPDAP